MFRPSIMGSEALREELPMNSLPTIPLFPAAQIVATPGALYWSWPTRLHWNSCGTIFAAMGRSVPRGQG